MRHAVLARTRHDAQQLTAAIQAAGWFARIVTHGRNVGVIIHAPTRVVNLACLSVGFNPGRTLSVVS